MENISFKDEHDALSSAMKKQLIFIIQAIVSIGLLVWIFRSPALRDNISHVLAAAHPGWLVAGVLTSGAGCFLAILRWGIFLRILGIELPARDIVRLGLAGMFFNTFLPGGVGGDVVKIVWLGARGASRSLAALSVVMDRLSGLVGLIICACLFVVPTAGRLMESPALAIAVPAVFVYLGCVAALLVFSFVMSSLRERQPLPKWLPGRAAIVEWTSSYFQFARMWRRSLIGVAVSALMLVCYYLSYWCAAQAFEAGISLPLFFGLMPVIDAVAAIPVSLGGLGVREQAFVTSLGQLLAIPADKAVLISLTGYALNAAWGLLGLAMLPSKFSTKEPAQ